jgi:hypothetical protein
MALWRGAARLAPRSHSAGSWSVPHPLDGGTAGEHTARASGTTESPTIAAMAISPNWYRENANACAWRAEQSRDALVKASYKEMVRAWLITGRVR